jgi:hypothetical protein
MFTTPAIERFLARGNTAQARLCLMRNLVRASDTTPNTQTTTGRRSCDPMLTAWIALCGSPSLHAP